jgi:hypothetical protein
LTAAGLDYGENLNETPQGYSREQAMLFTSSAERGKIGAPQEYPKGVDHHQS